MTGATCEWCTRPAVHFPVMEEGRGFCHRCSECDCVLCGECSDGLGEWAEWADALELPEEARAKCDQCGA